MSIKEILHLFDIGKISVSLCNHSLETARDHFAIDFLDSIREYERENGSRICFDERSSLELLETYKREKGL